MNETTLCKIWNRLEFDRDGLRDEGGTPLWIVFRGRWQHGPGPDFRGAVLARPDGSLARGDIEIHLHTGDWPSHGHHRDPSFDRVILHVVLRHDPRIPTLRHDGAPVPVLALGERIGDRRPIVSDPLARDPWLDEPCRAVVRSLDDPELGRRLDQAGDARLRDHAARFEGDLCVWDRDEVIYQGLMECMGYGRNRAAFRELARTLPLAELLATVEDGAGPSAIFSALARVGGLDVASGFSAAGGHSRFGWRTVGVRPANHPARRLLGMAHILSRYAPAGLATGLCLAWPQEAPRRVANALARRLLVPGPSSPPSGAHLVGRGRAADAVVNVLLPFTLAWADLHDRPELARQVDDVYRRHPALASNETTRALVDLWGLPPARRRLTRPARRQQGLIHIYRTYCEDRLCPECPLAGIDWQSDP